MGFRKIRLNISKEERDKAKQDYGAKWFPYLLKDIAKSSDEYGFWCVNDKTDCAAMNPQWRSAVKWSISELYHYLEENLCYFAPPCTIEADVHNVYEVPSADMYMVKLVDHHNLKQPLQVRISSSVFAQKEISPDEIDRKRVRVTGTIYVYGNTSSSADYLPHRPEFQLKVYDLEIIGEGSFNIDVERWAAECKDILKPESEMNEKSVPPLSFTRVGVIAPSTSHGLEDFMDKLKEKSRVITEDVVDVERISSRFSSENIVDKIQQFNAEKSCDVICIIRGGGDYEDLIEYSRPELLRAIHNSDIPVVTGIAHYDDILLCDRVAYYAARTPTDAADYLNRAKRLEKSMQKTRYQKKVNEEKNRKLGEAQKAQADWRTRYEELQRQYAEINNAYETAEAQIAALQQQVNDLHKSAVAHESSGGLIGLIKKFLGK